MSDLLRKGSKEDDPKRIRECVTALRGIKNPSGFVDAVRKLLLSYSEWNDSDEKSWNDSNKKSLLKQVRAISEILCRFDLSLVRISDAKWRNDMDRRIEAEWRLRNLKRRMST